MSIYSRVLVVTVAAGDRDALTTLPAAISALLFDSELSADNVFEFTHSEAFHDHETYSFMFMKFATAKDAKNALLVMDGTHQLPARFSNSYQFPDLPDYPPQHSPCSWPLCKYFGRSDHLDPCPNGYSHHPRDLFNAELPSLENLSHLWFSDFQCGSWGLRYSRELGLKGANLFEKIVNCAFEKRLLQQKAKYVKFTNTREQVILQWEQEEREARERLQRTESDIAELVKAAGQFAAEARAVQEHCDANLLELQALIKQRQQACLELQEKSKQISFQAVNWRHESIRKIAQALGPHVVERVIQCGAEDFSDCFESERSTSHALCNQVIAVPQRMQAYIANWKASGVPANVPELRGLLQGVPDRSQLLVTADALKATLTRTTAFVVLLLDLAICTQLEDSPANADKKKETKRKAKIADLVAKIDAAVGLLPAVDAVVADFPPLLHLPAALTSACTVKDTAGANTEAEASVTAAPPVTAETVSVPPLAVAPAEPIKAAVDTSAAASTAAVTEESAAPSPVLISTQPAVPTEEIWSTYYELCTVALASKQEDNQARSLYCKCKAHANPHDALVKCSECDLLFCEKLAAAHMRNISNKKHHLFRLCPVCAEYSSLHYCALCLAEGISDGALTCGSCQLDRHLEVDHDCILLDAFVGTPGASTSNSPMQGGSPVPTSSPATSTATSPLPPTPPVVPAAAAPPAPAPLQNLSATSSAATSAVPGASAPASALDNERLYMVHCRAAIEEVAQPVVIAYFKRRWEQIAPVCLGCKPHKKHPFEQVNTGCLQHIVQNLNYFDSAFQCVQRMGLAKYNNNIAECLQCSFDLGAIGNLVKKFEFDTQGMCPSEGAIHDLVKLRGDCFHKATMDIAARDDLIKDVQLNCCKIAAPMLPQFAWSLERIAKALQGVQDFGGDVLLKFKEQILRETQRQTDLQVHRLVSSTFAAAVVTRSKEIADLLCSDDQLKFLVIPTLQDAQPDARKETPRRAQHRAALSFLLDVSWAGILDMNQLWFTDPDAPNTLDVEAFGKLEVTTVPKTDLSCYGKTSTLYTSLDADIVKLRAHFALTPSQIVVAGFGDLSYSDESMRKLMRTFDRITSPLYTNERDWQAVPIVEDAQLLLNSHMRGVFCPEESSVAAGAPSSVDQCAALVADLAFVESFVSGRVSKASNVWLPASERFCKRVGFPAKALTVYASCLEVLTFNCEATPLYVTMDEITAMETTFDKDQVRTAVAELELQRFLRGGKKASWLLYNTRPCKIVMRNIVRDIVAVLRLQTHHTITLTHAIGAGATTIGRNVLFELRHEFVCMAIFSSVSDVSGICEVFRELCSKTGLPLLVLLDFHASATRLYDIRNKLMHRNVFFLCPALIERGVNVASPAGSIRIAFENVDTVFTKTSATSQELMCTLPFVPNAEEQRAFAQLSNSREFSLGGRCLTPYFTQLGNLDIPKLFASAEQQPAGQETVVEAILSHSNDALVAAGFNPIDIVDLRAEYIGYGKGHFVVRCRRDVALAPVLYGLFAFDPAYAKRASAFALSVLHDHLDATEIAVIKLCCFYALFAPSQKVPLKVASYISNGNIMPIKPVVWSHSMLQLIEVDHTPPGFLSIKVLKLAYVLAESPSIFDDRKQWNATISAYLHETLFALLSHGSTYQSDLLELIEPGYVQAFVEFKIWHPETTRHQVHAGKALSYSFLIELVLQESKQPGNYEKVKELMLALFTLYKQSESQVFSTHTARFLTNYAEKLKVFSAVCKAEEILLSLSSKDVSAVCDRLGHVYKSHVRIIYSLLSTNKLRLTYGKDQDVAEATGQGYLHDHPGQDYFSMKSIAFSTVFDIALLADQWFAKAMKLSKYSVPNPMIGAAQVWDTVLAIVKYALCADSPVTFREYYERTRQHGSQQAIFDQIRREEVFEWCEDYLQGARSAAKYKRKQKEQDRSEREYFTQHGQEATNDKIWELWDHLEKYQKAEREVREFTNFNLAIVKHWMTGKKNYELSCDKLCFCILTLANQIFPPAAAATAASVEASPLALAGPKPSAATAVPAKYTKKSAGSSSGAVDVKGPGKVDTQATKAPSGPAATKRALNIGACMEMFFQASCLLTSHSPSAAADALQYFSDRCNRPDLWALMHDPHTLQPKIEQWVKLSSQGSDFGLSARVSMVAMLLWRILINKETNAFVTLKTAHSELETESESYFFKNKARLFLAKERPGSICNPFSSFYFYDALPFASQLTGRPYREHERIYCSEECYDCLHVCQGVLKKARRNYFVVSCQQLQLDDIFMFSGDSTSHLEENQKVTFVLAIRDGGLIALGVRAAEEDAGK